MMKKTEVQLFDNSYRMRCETFGCGETSIYFVGRPDAPLSTALNLCKTCGDQLVRSVVQKFDLHAKSSHAPKGKEALTITNGETEVVIANDATTITAGDITVDNVHHVIPSNTDNADNNAVNDDNDDEPTLEEIVQSLRTHAELDELAAELGVEGVPSREDSKLDVRKQFVIDAVDKQIEAGE